jgi:UMF1 family MFS transporter
VFVRAEPPPFGLDPDAAEHVRATLPLAAAWFALFSLPVFLIVPETGHCRGAAFEAAVKGGVANLWNTVRQVPRYANIARYLLAHMIYTDGLNTLFAFGGIYAAGTFGFEMAELILFGIALNVTAGMGAAAFAWMDDRIGARATVLLSLCFIVGLGVPLLLVDSKPWFWVLGLAISVFFGPVQAASRSLMGRLAPETKRAEMFGLHALSGKITAFLGPALLAWATGFFQSQRAGMATIVGLLVVGGLILLSVKEPARR